jgi:hypothetical protein
VNALLEPGMIVRHPLQPEWGLGQVQSNIKGRVTVNFEHRGKVVVIEDFISLVTVHDQDQAAVTGQTQTE